MLVYSATNIDNGKSYIGVTGRPIEKRIREHRRHSKIEDSKFYRAIRKHGFSSFAFYVLHEAKNSEEMKSKEVELIAANNTIRNGYNTGTGGDHSHGWKASIETKNRLSEARKSIDLTGSRNPFYGKTHSQAMRDKWSIERSGKNHPAYGRKHTKDELLKMSKAAKKPKSEAQKRAASISGRKLDYISIVNDFKNGLSNPEISKKYNCNKCHISVIRSKHKRGIL